MDPIMEVEGFKCMDCDTEIKDLKDAEEHYHMTGHIVKALVRLELPDYIVDALNESLPEEDIDDFLILALQEALRKMEEEYERRNDKGSR